MTLRCKSCKTCKKAAASGLPFKGLPSVPMVDSVFINNNQQESAEEALKPRTPGFRSSRIAAATTQEEGLRQDGPGRTQHENEKDGLGRTGTTPGFRKTGLSKAESSTEASSFTAVAQQIAVPGDKNDDNDDNKGKKKKEKNSACGDKEEPKNGAGCSEGHAENAKVSVGVQAAPSGSHQAVTPGTHQVDTHAGAISAHAGGTSVVDAAVVTAAKDAFVTPGVHTEQAEQGGAVLRLDSHQGQHVGTGEDNEDEEIEKIIRRHFAPQSTGPASFDPNRAYKMNFLKNKDLYKDFKKWRSVNMSYLDALDIIFSESQHKLYEVPGGLEAGILFEAARLPLDNFFSWITQEMIMYSMQASVKRLYKFIMAAEFFQCLGMSQQQQKQQQQHTGKINLKAEFKTQKIAECFDDCFAMNIIEKAGGPPECVVISLYGKELRFKTESYDAYKVIVHFLHGEK